MAPEKRQAMTNDNETERTSSALFTISPDLPHDQWVRVGMAAHAGGLSFDEWDGWSRQGSNYNPATARDAWRSFSDKPGGVKVATLFKIAREHGWVDRSSSGANQRQAPAVGFAGLIDKPTAPAPEKKFKRGMSPDEVWGRCEPVPPDHPYIIKKGLQNAPLSSLRMLPAGDWLHITGKRMGGALVVPGYNFDGELCSLQFVPEEGRKLNLPGTSMSGLMHPLGEVVPGANPKFCEGIGTALTVRVAGEPLAISCFGWGNVGKVATEWRQRYPSDNLTLLPDVDKEESAAKIAATVGASVAYMPAGWESNSDLNDLQQHEGVDAVRDILASAVQPAQPPAPEPRFKLLKDADIDGMPDLEWLIHGILPTKGMGAVFGPSGSGKSFVIIDMACAIAEGRHWFGYRTTKTPIVYIVLEGAQGLKNRRRAWLKHHNRAALPDGIHFIVQPVNFMEGDVYELAEVLPPGCMTIVDTLNRAAPGADENASKDMGLILAATSAISRATGGLTVLVHHTGKNEDAGLRGHSSLKAALDGSIVVTRNGEARAWKADKSKDGPDGQSHPFKLEVVNLGFDKYGDTISSCVVTPDTSGRQHIKPLTPSQRSAIGTYCAACDEGLGLVSDSFEFLGLHLEAWRKVFYQLSPGDNEDSKRKAFNRARKDLIDNGLATVETDVYRITERTAATREGEFIEKTLIKNDSGTSGTKRDMSRTVPAQKPQNSGTSGTRLLGVSRCPAGIDPIQAETELGKNGEKSSSFSGADEDEGEI
jgi:hypothetical protein